MKAISYSLFKDCEDWEFGYYLRGLYFNLRMNRLIYPEWVTFIHVEQKIYEEDEHYMADLVELFQCKIITFNKCPRCEAMLMRLNVAFNEQVSYILCRDLDSITTYRESKSVERWLLSNNNAHGMNDNPAHGGMALMGGMCGFKADVIRKLFDSFHYLIYDFDLTKHGSDQQLIGERIYPHIKDSFYFDQSPANNTAEYYSNNLWESDLTCRHIGSAGVVDMELLRFFNRHDRNNNQYKDFETKHRHICYWR